MKNFITSLLIFVSVIGFSQTITLDEMIKLRGKPLNEVNDYIISKGLNLDRANDVETVWKKGNLFFGYKKMDDGSIEVAVQTQNKKQYEALLTSVKAKGMKVVKTFSMSDPYQALVTQYEDKSFIVNSKVMTNNDANAYSFTLGKK
ncbi:MAG: hypothetical protein U0W65_00040 [Bacteroidia bacterium]